MKRCICILKLIFFLFLPVNGQEKIQWKKRNLTEETLSFLINGNYRFAGVANIETFPDRNVESTYYLAAMPGKYVGFGNIKLGKGELCVIYNKQADRSLQHTTMSKYNAAINTVELSQGLLRNAVITQESGWNESFSDITVMSDYLAVIQGVEYIPINLGNYRLTIYHYDANRKFIDISSWYSLNGPFIALGDYVKMGVRNMPLKRITPKEVSKQNIRLIYDPHRLAKLNLERKKETEKANIIFFDDFTEFDSTKWERYDSSNPPFALDFGKAPFLPHNVTVSNGCLVIEARKGNCEVGGKCFPYSTGMVDTRGKFALMSGRVDIRMRAEYCSGFNAGLWLNPQFGRWPEGQEIDIVEITKRNYAAGSLHYTKWPSFTNTRSAVHDDVITKPYDGKIDLSDWHVWGCEWDADEIRYYCDNVLHGIIKKEEVLPDISFDKSARYILLSYGMGASEFLKDSYKMHIDWVRVYSSDKETMSPENDIVLEYDMEHPLVMKPNEWRGIYPRLAVADGTKMATLKLKILQGDGDIISTGSSNMVLFSKSKGTAICEISGCGMHKSFRVVVE